MLRLAPLLCLLLGLLLAAPAHATPLPPWGTGESQGEDLSISLITFGPGDDVPSWFGHAALVVEDRRLRQGRLYNYGMFSFDERMLARYAMGRLEFWVGEASVGRTLDFYRSLNRSVRVQELALTPAQRVELARLLAQNVLPENRGYLYHHYNDNCSTRPRDMVDRVLGGSFRAANQEPARMTLREHTRRYTAVNAGMSLLLDFLMNDEIDRPIARWEEAFLPEELERQVAAHSLAAQSWVYSEAQGRPATPEQPPAYGPWLLGLGLLLGGGALGLAAWERRRGSRLARVLLGLECTAVGLGVGLPGTVLLLMWALTDHTVTYRNENLLLANPLTLLLAPLGVMLVFGSRRGRRWLGRLGLVLAGMAVLGLLLKALPPFNQDNWRLIALLLPVLVGMAGALRLVQAREPTAEGSTGSQGLGLI